MITAEAVRPAEDRYEVDLEVFHGPLDLLLHLIERRELDITSVSLAAVTDQYVDYVRRLAEPDVDELANFLVIAARLLAIKALALIARPAEQVAGTTEDAEDLVRALREYQLYKHAAALLHSWECTPRRCYPRLVPTLPVRPPSLGGLTFTDLIEALQAALTPPVSQGASAPPLPTLAYTVTDKISLITEKLASHGKVAFHNLLPVGASFLEAVVTFLALLEMVKASTVTVVQEIVFGPILINRRRGMDEGAPPH